MAIRKKKMENFWLNLVIAVAYLNIRTSSFFFLNIWKLSTPSKVKILLWLAFLDRLHTEGVL